MRGRDRVPRARSNLCRETSRVPARGRQSQNVLVPYPRRVRISPCQATQNAHLQGLYASALTDSNRRPPSLPWRFSGGTGGDGRALAITFLLHLGPSQCVDRVRACPRAPRLTYPSRTRDSLSVCRTYNGDAAVPPAPTDLVSVTVQPQIVAIGAIAQFCVRKLARAGPSGYRGKVC